MNQVDSNILNNSIRNILDNANNYILFGDFNFPGINWSTGQTTTANEYNFYNMLNEVAAVQMINEPTTEYSSLLDLCICSSDTIATDVEIGELFSTSDHSIIKCKLAFPFHKKK